jgi:hypothetical protein
MSLRAGTNCLTAPKKIQGWVQFWVQSITLNRAPR